MKIKIIKKNLIISIPIKKIKELLEVKEVCEVIPEAPDALPDVLPEVEQIIEPVIEPEVINMALDYFNSHDYPFVYFAPVDGLDVEVFTYELLKEAHKNATTDYDKEHVTPYMRRKTKISVDNESDLEKVRRVYGMGK